jgi:hypothetical protein
VEPAFGNIRHNQRLNRFTLRGQHKVGTPWPLYWVVHSIEKLAGREMNMKMPMKKQGGKSGSIGARMLATGRVTAPWGGPLHRKRDQEETRP